MKNISLIILTVFAVMAFNACRTIYPSAEVNYISGTEQTVTVRSVGIGINEEKALINAEQKVFDVLFFRGLPQSNQKLPMVGSDESAKKQSTKIILINFMMGNVIRHL